ncbi:MAG TPA: methylated-DNA--[protein]-cysteine S-methyltransferase [Rhizomicrobium sp.]
MIRESLRWGLIETRFSIFTAWVDDAGCLVRFWLNPRNPEKFDSDARRDQNAIASVSTQIEEYCAGSRQKFDLALAPQGTPFQHEVWDALLKIPFGTTTSYGALATALGRSGAARAVGLANGSNPIGLIVPCHRVIGSDGSLTGYGGGLPLKRALLQHEADVARGEGDLFAPKRNRAQADRIANLPPG